MSLYEAIAALSLALLLRPWGCLGQAEQAKHPDGDAARVTLECVDGALSISGADGRRAVSIEGTPLPYRIVYGGEPALVTTCTPDLQCATYAVSEDIVCFDGWLPIHAQPGWAVLQQVYNPEVIAANSLKLIDSSGFVMYETRQGYLSQPLVADGVVDTAYIVEAPGAEPLNPLGPAPGLTALEADIGGELWSISFENLVRPVDIQIFAVTSDRALVCIQLGYEQYAFALVDLRNGLVLDSFDLAGQPAYSLAWPGAFDELTYCVLGDNSVILLVSTLASEFELWEFKLDTAELEIQPGWQPEQLKEYNSLPVGGSGSPGPGLHPFPQALLPDTAGNNWTIEAWRDPWRGILMITTDGAQWEPLE